MRSIHVLDASIANKIAAGEVVERPASVIKELLENSIDAGGTRIFIDVEDAGKTMIRIADNGQGIPADQVPLAFLRHATSKIETVQDIYAIESLGFRGEALASISAVSKIEMLTKVQDAELGLKYVIEGGLVLSSGPIGTNNGTTLTIRDLFFNTPARYKFMKSDISENIAILDCIHKIGISHPEIAIQYKNNGKLLFHSKGDGKREVILYDLWGSDLHKQLVQYTVETDAYTMTAYFSRPSYSRGNRHYQQLIVNGRSVRSKTITDGVFEGYRTLLMVNRFPAWVIILDMPPTDFDINIHPAKMDIKFQHEQLIRSQMSGHVRAALLNTHQIPEMLSQDKSKVEPIAIWPSKTIEDIEDIFSGSSQTEFKGIQEHPDAYRGSQHIEVNSSPFKLLDAMLAFAEAEQQSTENQITNEIPLVNQQNLIEERHLFIDMKPLGVFQNAYILGEHDNCLYVIDQHAAHERILFETFLKADQTKSIERQILLIPLTKAVDLKTMLCFEAYTHYFDRLGFTLDKLGDKTLVLREAPSLLTYEQSTQLMETLLELIQNDESRKQTLTLEDFAKKACKSAVKAHDALTHMEIKKLLYDLSKCDNPYTCPHGRPISISISQNKIEKRFKRI